MRDKPKKTKEIKVRDLKPVKDPQGGVPPPCGPSRSGPRPNIPPPCRVLSALVVIAALLTLQEAQAIPPAPAHGYTNDCENLISIHQTGPNTIIVLSITATFTGTFDGTWTGTERDVIHGDGSGMVHGSGIFTGSVNVNGSVRSGTMTFSYIVTFPPDGRDVTHWVVDQGTGDLAGIHGQGTTPSDEETGPTEDCPWDTFVVEYSGQIQFGP